MWWKCLHCLTSRPFLLLPRSRYNLRHLGPVRWDHQWDLRYPALYKRLRWSLLYAHLSKCTGYSASHHISSANRNFYLTGGSVQLSCVLVWLGVRLSLTNLDRPGLPRRVKHRPFDLELEPRHLSARRLLWKICLGTRLPMSVQSLAMVLPLTWDHRPVCGHHSTMPVAAARPPPVQSANPLILWCVPASNVDDHWVCLRTQQMLLPIKRPR